MTPGSRAAATFRGSFVFAGSGVLLRVFSVATNVVLRRWLPPAQFGLWNLVQVMVDFVGKFDVGSSAAIERDLPMEVGRGDAGQVLALQSSALVLVLLQGLIGGLIVSLYYFWVAASPADPDAPIAWLGAVFMAAATPTAMIARSVLQSHGHFDKAGYLGVGSGILNAALTLVGARVGGAVGLVVGGVSAACLSALLSVGYLRFVGIQLSLRRWSKEGMKRIARFGLPLRIFDYPSSVYSGIDPLVVAAMYDRSALAIYSTARLFSTVGQEWSSRLTAPVRNEWRIELGRNPDSLALHQGSFEVLTVQALVVLPAVATMTYLAAQILVLWFLPEYTESLAVLPYLLLAWWLYPPAYGMRDLWVVRARFRPIFLTGLAALAAFGGGLWLVRNFLSLSGIVGVAVAYLLSGGVYTALLLLTVGRDMWRGLRTWIAGGCIACGTLLTQLAMRQVVIQPGWVPGDLRGLPLGGTLRAIVLLGASLAIWYGVCRVLPAPQREEAPSA